MRLTLIRHAKSIHSQSGIIAGIKSCPGLSEEGYTQGHRLADHFRTRGDRRSFQALLTSPVLRARQTADILAPALSAGAPLVDPDLVELIPGDADGLPYALYRERYGDFHPEVEPDRPFAPNGESWSGFMDRVSGVLDRLAGQYAGQDVAAVTHAGFIVATFILLFQLPHFGGQGEAKSRATINPAHTSITEWQEDHGAWQLLRYNCNSL